MNLQRLNRQGRLNRRLVRKQQDGTIGTETQEPEDTEDDYIQFGNNTYNLGGSPDAGQISPPVRAASTSPPAPSSPANTSSPAAASNPLWPLVLATALGAGGLGVGLTSWLTRPATQPAAVSADTDTQYQLDFGGKKAKVEP